MTNAAVTTKKNDTIQVTFTSAGSAWGIAADVPEFNAVGMTVKNIRFTKSALSDKARIRDTNSAGVILFDVGSGAPFVWTESYGDQGMKMWPSITMSQQTFSSSASCVFRFELA
jgi:hypothetical protein